MSAGRMASSGLDFLPGSGRVPGLVCSCAMRPPELEELSPAVWREWAPILIDWTTTINGASEEDKRRLLMLARPHAEEQLRETMLALVDKAIADASMSFLRTSSTRCLPTDSHETFSSDLRNPWPRTHGGPSWTFSSNGI